MISAKISFLALLAILLSPMAANAGLIRLEGTFSSTTNFTGPLNGGTFAGVYDFDGSVVGDFDIDLIDAGGAVLANLTQVTASALWLPEWGNPDFEGLQFVSNDTPTDFLVVVFAGGTNAIGEVVAFPINLPFASFAGIGGNTLETGSAVASGTARAVPEPGIFALLGIGFLAIGLSRRRNRI